APDGCPVAIEVFDGNTGDPTTLAPQIEKLKQRFGLDHVVLVGDRGMITQARITDDIKSAGLDWITSLRAPAIKELLNSGALQLSLFDQRDMASITSPDKRPSVAASAAISAVLRAKPKAASVISRSKCFRILCVLSTSPTARAISAVPRSGSRLRPTAALMRARSRSVATSSSSRLRVH